MRLASAHVPGAGDFRRVRMRAGIVGWIKRDLPEKFFVRFMDDPEASLNGPSARILKDGPKTKVSRTTLANSTGFALDVVIKRFRYRFLPRRLAFLLFPSPALRSLKGALLLKQNGFQTAEPLGAFELRTWTDLGTSYYVTRAIQDGVSLRAFWLDVLPTLPTAERILLGRSVLRELAQLIGRLHTMGVYHRDLKSSNILIQNWDSERRRFFLVDIDGVRQRARLPAARRIKNLIQVRGPWSRREKIYLFRRYAELFCDSRTDCKAMIRGALIPSGARKAGRAHA